MFGNVTENTLDTWTAVLEDEETKKLNERTYSHGQENEGKVAELHVVIACCHYRFHKIRFELTWNTI